jgi:hypothetical protein
LTQQASVEARYVIECSPAFLAAGAQAWQFRGNCWCRNTLDTVGIPSSHHIRNRRFHLLEIE